QAAALKANQRNSNLALHSKTARDRGQLLGLIRPSSPKQSARAKIQRMARADATRQRGLVIDYVSVFTWSVTDYQFKSDSTYYISGTLTAGGITVLEPAVIKFTNYNYSAPAQIKITGSGAKLNCRTSAYRPAIFSSKDDNSVG